MSTARVTQRTFYPAIMDAVRAGGGEAVQEVVYKSVPDILFQLGGHRWLLSVRIGDDQGCVPAVLASQVGQRD